MWPFLDSLTAAGNCPKAGDQALARSLTADLARYENAS